MKARISGLDESFQVALDTLAKDEFLGVEELSSLVKDNINIAFEEVSGHSKAFAEAMVLVTDNSYDTHASFIKMKSGIDDLNHSFELDDIEVNSEELEEAKVKLEEFYDTDGNLLVEVNDQELLDASEHYDELSTKLENDSFSLSIDIAGDLIDQIE